MKNIFSLMREVSYIVLTVIFAALISVATSIPSLIVVGVLMAVRYIPMPMLGQPGVLATLLGTHTGQTSYSGNIDQPIARLLIDADSTTSLATVTAAKLTLSQATKRKTGTMIPELTFAQLADIAGFIDAVYYQMTAEFRIKFSVPISLGGAYDLEGGSLTYNLSNCTAADTIKVYAIDDAKRELDYIEVIPVGTVANNNKNVDLTMGAYLFIDPTVLTRIKINYPGGISVEYVGEEIQEIARILNPVNKVTNAGLITPGYEALSGVIVRDAVSAEIQFSSATTFYVLKHLLAN